MLTFCLILSTYGQVRISSSSERILDEVYSLYQNNDGKWNNNLSSPYTVLNIDGEYYLSMLAKIAKSFSNSDLPENMIVGARSGDIITLKVALSAIPEIKKTESLISAEISPKIIPHLEKARLDTRADSVHMGLNLPIAFTGKDVIVGVTDWGFDYTHPMFYDSTLTNTRILAVWDQARMEGPAPSGYTYGTQIEGSNDLLQYQADTATDFYSYATHGSHVAGIAGGGGAGIGLYGIAPSCDFIFCQVILDAASSIDAVSWMQDYAESKGKRLVINMSWGLYQLGPLDGTSIISEAFDAFVDEGVVIVTSNGNNGSTDLHIKKEFTGDTITSRVGMVVTSNPNWWGQNLIMWGEKNTSFQAGFDVYQSGNLVTSGPWYATSTMSGHFDSILVVGNDTIIYDITQDSVHPDNQCPHMSLKVRNRYSKYAIVLKATSSNSTVHFYNITHNLDHVANWGYDFTSLGPHGVSGDNEYTIGEPACTKKVISVGAHLSEIRLPFDTIVGDITSFSSRGPSIDERTKPEITAPGSGIESSINSFTDENYTPSRSVNFKGKSYDFGKFSGTSMSGPMVTGVVALLLEARQFATPAQIKEIIIETARTDEKTGNIPSNGSNTWGWGKVNARLAVERALEVVSIEEVSYSQQWIIYPNPGGNELNIKHNAGYIPETITIMDTQGKILLEGKRQTEINASTLTQGMYIVRITQGIKSINFKWIKY